jgi:hypothetical protein
VLDCSATPDIKDHYSSIQYSRLFLTKFLVTLILVTLLLEESNLYCHQYYIIQANSNLLSQAISDEEKKVCNAPILYRGTWRATGAQGACLKKIFKPYLVIFWYYTNNATPSTPLPTEKSRSRVICRSREVYVPKFAILLSVPPSHGAPCHCSNNWSYQGVAVFRQCIPQEHKIKKT